MAPLGWSVLGASVGRTTLPELAAWEAWVFRGQWLHRPAAEAHRPPRICGRVSAVAREFPQDLAGEWHDLELLSLTRRQPATMAGALTDQARVCLAAPQPASAKLLACVIGQRQTRWLASGELRKTWCLRGRLTAAPGPVVGAVAPTGTTQGTDPITSSPLRRHCG